VSTLFAKKIKNVGLFWQKATEENVKTRKTWKTDSAVHPRLTRPTVAQIMIINFIIETLILKQLKKWNDYMNGQQLIELNC
jgi:hypothetical protein